MVGVRVAEVDATDRVYGTGCDTMTYLPYPVRAAGLSHRS